MDSKHCVASKLLGVLMKILLAIIAALLTPSLWATTYYLSPTGSDANNGTSLGTPWLSPNHAINCGDVILAAASTSYSAANFAQGKWGTVTCPAGNNVAWVRCASFDACKITSTTGIQIASSYWGIQGFEFTTTGSSSNSCIFIGGTGTGILHHIVIANNVLNVCPGTGLQAANSNTSTSFDYVAYVGNIVYGAAGGNTSSCSSGMSFYQPIAYDSLPGTHLYVAGNFAIANADPPTCNGQPSTDGEGLILDTLDFSQGSGTPYSQQVAVENNMFISNGSYGFEALNNAAGGNAANNAKIFVQNNTSWGNMLNRGNGTTWCGEELINAAYNVQESNELAVTSSTNGCSSSNPLYAYYVTQSATTTNYVYSSWGYSAAGTNGGINGSAGFSYGPNNTFGTNPTLANPTVPGAPSCGSATSAPNCMATVIANFTPTATAAQNYGYQAVSATSRYDPLYPQWLCSVTNLPSGLVTPGCVTASAHAGESVSGSIWQ